MKKTMRIGTMDTGNGRRASIYIRCKIEDGELSLTGVIGPLPNGGALGGCGQIDMEFSHRKPKNDDKRYKQPIRPEDIRFTTDWDKNMWWELLDVWTRWHLNHMNAACKHQRKLGWTYEAHHNAKTFEGEACPTCGYKIGSAWLKEPLPQKVIDFLGSLPETDQKPAWV